MNHSPEIAAEVSALVNGWRAKAMTIVMSLVALIALPALILVEFSPGFDWPWIARGAGLAGVLALLLGVWRRDWSLRRRALICFGTVYGVTALQWATSGLAGSGRLGLLLLPILALILVGRRAGWLAVGFSVVMLGAFTALAATGVLAGRLIIPENSTDLGFWLVQGLLLLAALVPLMALLTRFQALQTQTMIEERCARRDFEAAVAERQRLEAEITRVSEDERRRVGADLHDGVCQQLTAALLSCTAIERDLAARGAPEDAATRRLRGLLEDCIGSAYDAAKGLCPVDMNPESLVPALQRLAAQVRQNAGVVCEVREQGDLPVLHPQTTLHLYRVAQEAVNNAAKHARCRRITLELRGSPEGCRLSVIDDGHGSPPGVPPASGGLGTQIMNYRAKAIGGTLRIEHPEAGGTVVHCEVPSGRPARPAAVVSRN